MKNLSGDDSASLKAKNAKPAVQETKVSNNNNKKRSGDTEISRNKNREVLNRNSSTANNVIDVNDVNLDDLKSKLIASSQSIDIKQCQLKLVGVMCNNNFDI